LNLWLLYHQSSRGILLGLWVQKCRRKVPWARLGQVVRVDHADNGLYTGGTGLNKRRNWYLFQYHC